MPSYNYQVIMKRYKDLNLSNSGYFVRMVGLLPEQFTELHHKLVEYVETTKRLNPLRRRGRKEGKLSLEDQLLLTLYYLRHYPTFVNLGAIFGISESYCCNSVHPHSANAGKNSTPS